MTEEQARDAAIKNADFSNVFQAKTAFVLGFDAALEYADRWTYCEDALPERYDDYLITLANQSVCRAAYSTFSNNWMIPGIGWASDVAPVIAWQPLPAPAEPKEAK